MPRETLLFIHIPKAAGTSLKTALSGQHAREATFELHENSAGRRRDDLLALPGDRLRSLQLVMGHFDYGLHEALPMSCRYLTMLREPIARIVSLYDYALRETVHRHHGVVQNMTLEEYVSSGINPETSNGMVKRFGGDLRSAWTNLQKVTFGVSERFDDSLELFRRSFGWKNVSYQRKNVGVARVASPEEVATISALNDADVEFYRRALDLFEDRSREPQRARRRFLPRSVPGTTRRRSTSPSSSSEPRA